MEENKNIKDDVVTQTLIERDIIPKKVAEGEQKKKIKLHKVVEGLGLEIVHQSSDYYDISLSLSLIHI